MAQGIWHSEDKPLKTLGTDGGKAAIGTQALQPNVAGIGLNLNNMIDDYVAREAEKASRPRPESPAPPRV